MSKSMPTPISTAGKRTWVAFGATGAVGSIHESSDGFAAKLLTDSESRGSYPTLEIAKNAIYAGMLPGSDWPDFREH